MFKEMPINQRDEIIRRFVAETGAQPQASGERYKKGVCPSCGKKSLWIFGDNPWKIQCDKLNSCGYEISAREMYPDVFENFSKRYATEMETDSRAIAKAYLREARDFNTAIVNNFTQESYTDFSTKATTPTVRFAMPGDGYWERFIENLESFEQKARFKPGYSYKGLAWQVPNLEPSKIKQLWVVEGIFDAISLLHHGIYAISAMSANNFPEHTLKQIYQANHRIELVIALDSDVVGRKSCLKFYEKAREMGFGKVKVAITGSEDDWNDKHLKEAFKPEDIEKYFYNGALLTAKTPVEKAQLMYERNNFNQFYLEFGNKTFWIKVDAEKLNQDNEVNETDDVKEVASFKSACTVTQIANCTIDFLYAQQEIGTNDKYYFLNVRTDKNQNKDAFNPKHLSSASEFKSRIVNTVTGATFTGKTEHLDKIYETKAGSLRDVNTVDFFGYANEVGAYIFKKFAVKNGQVFKINAEEYFELPKQTYIKSTFDMEKFEPSMEYQNTWTDDYFDVYGVKGVAVLAYWLGALFAEQIRDQFGSYPFLELTGDANAGKSSLLRFLWKILGRADYEGQNPNNGSKVGYLRTLAQVGNLPTVMIECEGFNLEDLKTLFDGGYLRTTGQKNMGNKTHMPKFRSALVLSQNERAITEGSRDNQLALLQRLIYVHFDTTRHTPARRKKAQRLETMDMKECSGFLLEALKHENQIMQKLNEVFEGYQDQIMSIPDMNVTRIGLTHGLMLSLLDALAMIIDIPEMLINNTREYICKIASERQTELKQDHPSLEQFWDAFDYLESQGYQVNHSRNKDYIAINLNQFYALCADLKQPIDDMKTIKKLLATAIRYKYLEHNKAVNSQYDDARILQPGQKLFKTLRCYYFARKSNVKTGS